MKPVTDILWTVVRWALPLTVAAVIVAAAVGSQRIGEEVRRRIESVLRERLPALGVVIRSASLVEGEGILVRGVTITAADGEIVAVDEIHLACGTTLADLATGMPQITAVRLRRPIVQARRLGDGRWNLSTIFANRGAGLAVPIDVEDATVSIEDAGAGRRAVLRNIGVALQPVDETGSAAGTIIRGRIGGDLFDAADFEGRVGHDGGFAVTGH
ncbi:MAG: hypothetical protein FJ275_02895, partial [Planctomycetes bacterium]|nr:hypothetical protein [Planctomycetota bacterium]